MTAAKIYKMSNTNLQQEIAAIANISMYQGSSAERYIDGAPHIKHQALRLLYASQVHKVFKNASQLKQEPLVLDLGSGEGSVTLPFLELGCRVIAVDISQNQLSQLAARCNKFSNRLEVKCIDLMKHLEESTQLYDVIVTNSLLHHIPDYIKLIKMAIARLHPGGQLLTFQDPLRYSTASKFTRCFSAVSYFVWRITKTDVMGGALRWMRRKLGTYLENCVEDNVEYHVVRDGVDQKMIIKIAKNSNCDTELVEYFSTQSSSMQKLGTFIGIKNTFSIILRRKL